MNIVCFGLSHRTAEVEVRERFAFADKELPAATRRLRALEGVREALILSTCNRVEHYAVLDDGPEPVRRARDLFRLYCETGGLDTHAEGEQFYHHDAPAQRGTPLPRGERAGLDGARRDGDPRSGQTGVQRRGRGGDDLAGVE